MRERWAGLALLMVAPWALVACAHENDDRPRVEALPPGCGDHLPTDEASIRALMRPGHNAEDTYDYALAISCDGRITAAEERCLRTPWARVPEIARPTEFAASPEEAVRASAGSATVIAEVLSRTARHARIAVLLDEDEGVYDVQRVRRGWVTVAGEGCATGVVDDGWASDDPEISDECQRAIDEATPDENGVAVVGCVEEVSEDEIGDLDLSDLDDIDDVHAPTCDEVSGGLPEPVEAPDSADAFTAQLMVCDE